MPATHFATRFRHPVDSSTLGFGFGEFNPDIAGGLYHLGDDYEVFRVDVHAIANGFVEDVGENGSFGKFVIIRHEMPNGQSIYSLYAHLEAIHVSEAGHPPVGIGDVIGLSGNTPAFPYHLHLEISQRNLFNGVGADFARGYDAATSPAFSGDRNLDGVLESAGITYDPSDFIDKYSTTGAVMRDFAPRGAAQARDAHPGNSSGGLQTITFDNLVAFDPDDVREVGNEYYFIAGVSDKVDGFDFSNIVLLHVPSSSFDGSGYDNGLISGDWIAYGAHGLAALIEGDREFDFRKATFTAAWNDGLDLVIEALDMVNGVYNVVGTVRLDLSTQDPLTYSFGSAFRDIDAVRLTSSGGTNAGLGGFGFHYAMDNLVFG